MMMKGKIVVAVSATLCAVFLACGIASCARTDFEYALSDDRSAYTLIYYGGNEPEVTVPSEHRGKPVTSVGAGAFAYCAVTEVTIPDSVQSIGSGAFEGCESLERVILPDGLTEICDETFSGCTSLREADIPKNVTEIGDSAFYGCTSLGKAAFGDFLTRIGERAFTGCSSLGSVYIPASARDIGQYAFCACSSVSAFYVDEGNEEYKAVDGNLYTADGTELLQYAAGKTEREFEMPLGVTSIGDGAFADCENLVTLTLSDNRAEGLEEGDGIPAGPAEDDPAETGDRPIYIGDYAFCGCTSLSSAEIFDDVMRIGDYAFCGCTALENADISGNVERFGEYAFSECTSLTGVELGNGVTQIGGHAFSGCVSLASMTIPESVTEIGECAFEGCTSLIDVTFENTNGWHVTTPGVTTGGTEINSLSDPSVNADYLTGIYCRYVWYTA